MTSRRPTHACRPAARGGWAHPTAGGVHPTSMLAAFVAGGGVEGWAEMDRAASSSLRDAPRYRRLAAIASGGMGTVDLCLRIEGDFQRLVAVKRLLPLLRIDESVREMFLEEARIA